MHAVVDVSVSWREGYVGSIGMDVPLIPDHICSRMYAIFRHYGTRKTEEVRPLHIGVMAETEMRRANFPWSRRLPKVHRGELRAFPSVDLLLAQHTDLAIYGVSERSIGLTNTCIILPGFYSFNPVLPARPGSASCPPAAP